MKTPKDPRHIERIKNMQELFAWEFSKENRLTSELVNQLIGHLNKIDKLIEEAAPSWPIKKINKTDLAILRLAIYELTIKKDVPIKVVVDEAVEIAKEYGSEKSAGFINGVLGKVITDKQLEK